MRTATYIDRTNEVFIPHQYVGHTDAEDYGKDPSTDKPFNSLFRRELDELSAAKRDTANVGEDVVCYYKGGR